MRRLASPRMMALRPCTEVLIRRRKGHAPLTTLLRRVIAAHSRLPQAHRHRNQAADQAAAGCEMPPSLIASSHSMHQVPSPHGSAPTGTTHEHSPGCAMPGRMVDDMQGGCGSCEPAAARRAPAPDEVGCRCASHISDGLMASTASLPAILRGPASSHHHRPPLRATAGSECQGGELPMHGWIPWVYRAPGTP